MQSPIVWKQEILWNIRWKKLRKKGIIRNHPSYQCKSHWIMILKKSMIYFVNRGLCTRMNWWNSPRCEFYRSVRNAVKLTKCWEILWSEPFRGLLWPNLWSEAGHIWARTTFPFICCAAGIGLHNCRHYNWLACVQPGLSAQKVNTTVKNNQSVIDASLHIIRNLSS